MPDMAKPANAVASAPKPGLGPSKRLGEFNEKVVALGRPEAKRPTFRRDEAYEASPEVREALAAIDGGAPVVLVTGRAGTGKTKLVRYLRERPGGERQAVVAPTGIAALNAQAQTIHSFFHLPPIVLDARRLPEGRPFGDLFRRMTRLVIDEISMVRVDLIDAIDARLRAARKDERPFGGVQVVMVGDFLQLPPVVERRDHSLLSGLGYRTPFAFSARALERTPVTSVALNRVYRQDEQDFIEILGWIRTGDRLDEAMRLLNERCVGPHRAGRQPLLLTPTRGAAERYNQDGLRALPSPSAVFEGRIEGKLEIDRDRLPVPERLELRVGARVMAVKNDLQGRWVNGSLGTIVHMGDGQVSVRFDQDGSIHQVARAEWEKIRQEWDESTQRIESRRVGAYSQIPLIHAWAITIHKAQGLTLDDVRLDLGRGAFAPGQVYVGLSRVRSLAGLSLARPLGPTDIKADPMLLAFTDWLQGKGGGA